LIDSVPLAACAVVKLPVPPVVAPDGSASSSQTRSSGAVAGAATLPRDVQALTVSVALRVAP
jgi:hypothetical protein